MLFCLLITISFAILKFATSAEGAYFTLYKGIQMDQINAKTMNVAEYADCPQTNDRKASEKENSLNVLDEWQLLLVGGGDTIVCW